MLDKLKTLTGLPVNQIAEVLAKPLEPKAYNLFSATPKLGFARASFTYENAANAGREATSEQPCAKPLV